MPTNYWLKFGNSACTFNGKGASYPIEQLPPHTIRCKFQSGYTPAMGDTQTLVDADENIWDIYNESVPWIIFLRGNEALLEIAGANLEGVTDLSYAFAFCPNLASTVLSGTEDVVNMGGLFYEDYALRRVSLFDTGNVTNMSCMFYQNHALEEVPFYNTSNVTAMTEMFRGCRTLRSIPRFDTSNVEGMAGLVSECTSLESFPALDTSRATNMGGMCHSCALLTEMPMLDTSRVTSLNATFHGCTALRSIPLWDTRSVANWASAFNRCTALEGIPAFRTDASEDVYMAFVNCRNVESGALAMYQQWSQQAGPQADHAYCFRNCGVDTVTGAAELAQIPIDWK